MKFINPHNLPPEIVKHLERSFWWKPKRYSLSHLIMPVRQRELIKRHDEEIVVDVADALFTLLGTGFHMLMERDHDPNVIKEGKIECKFGDFTVVGIPDRFEKSGLLKDYKVTSVWAVIDGAKDDWIGQLNTYAFLLSLKGHKVTELQVNAMLRDWSKGKAKQGGGYPPIAFKSLDIPLWTKEQTKQFVFNGIKAHESAKDIPDDQLPLCTADERWERPTIYAVMKKGKKSAEARFETVFDAEQHIETVGDLSRYHIDHKKTSRSEKWNVMKEGRKSPVKSCTSGFEANKEIKRLTSTSKLYIEAREGESPRCEDYCIAKDFCSQYKQMLVDQGKEVENES